MNGYTHEKMERWKAWYWLVLWLPLWANANPIDSAHIQVGLHSEVQSVQAGKPFWVALRLTPEEHWHTYWQNPGDSGAPPAATWTLPQGAKTGVIQWPTPQRIPVKHLVNIGYEGEVWLPVQITPPPKLNSSSFFNKRCFQLVGLSGRMYFWRDDTITRIPRF